MGKGFTGANLIVQIAAVVCAFSVGVVVVFAIFAQSQMIISAYIVAILALMGFGLSWLVIKNKTDQPKEAAKPGNSV